MNLRLWPDGGVTGVVERDNDIGDIFGSWDVKGICLFFLYRMVGTFEIMEKVLTTYIIEED